MMSEKQNSSLPKVQSDTVEAMKALFVELKNAAKQKKELNFKKTEDDFNSSFIQDSCPLGKCDGSGYFKKTLKNGTIVSVDCDCYKNEVLKRKLKRSQIQTSYWDVELEDLDTITKRVELELSLLKPLVVQKPKKEPSSKKKIPDPETPTEYIERSYEVKRIPYSLREFAENYLNSTLKLINQNPRTSTINLLLMGAPGKGKTYMSAIIAKEFLRKNKTVYFTRMRSLLDKAFDEKKEVVDIIKNVDLLIIDELAQEYHTDSQWALKQIQDIIKERQETNLPTICTTNAAPNELEDYYKESLMSTFNGRFVMTVFDSEYDLRKLDALDMYQKIDFLNF